MSYSEKEFANVTSFALSAYKIIREIKLDISKTYKLHGSSLFYILLVTNHPGINQETIGDMLGVNKSKVARTVDYLVKDGFANRIQDKENRRQNKIYVTEKGYNVAKAACLLYATKISNGNDKVEEELHEEFETFVEASLQLVD